MSCTRVTGIGGCGRCRRRSCRHLNPRRQRSIAGASAGVSATTTCGAALHIVRPTTVAVFECELIARSRGTPWVRSFVIWESAALDRDVPNPNHRLSPLATARSYRSSVYAQTFLAHHHDRHPDDEGRAKDDEDGLGAGHLRTPGVQSLPATVSTPAIGTPLCRTSIPHAHLVLVHSKSKCDGQQPVCGPCRDSGRADEVRRAPPCMLTSLRSHAPLILQCTWGRETAKKARTQQHFESLVNHIKSLEARVKELEGELSGSRSHPTRSGSVSDAARSAGSSSLSPHPSPVTKFELDDDAIPNGDDGIGSASSDNESEIEQLIAPTRHLVVRSTSFSRSLTLRMLIFRSHTVDQRRGRGVRTNVCLSSRPRTKIGWRGSHGRHQPHSSGFGSHQPISSIRLVSPPTARSTPLSRRA